MLLLCAILLEVALRVKGYDPGDKFTARTTEIEPQESFFVSDPVLGFKNAPGDFTLTLNGELSFKTSHNEDGYRGTIQPDSTMPEIWVFGCSFTYGWGVNTEESYPYMLDSLMSEYDVRNFGVGAYGTTQSLLQLRELLKSGVRPAAIVLAYADFHDQRNTGELYWLKALRVHEMMGEFELPVARLGEKGRLEFEYVKLEYDPVVGSSVLAIMKMIEDRRDQEDSEQKNSRKVSEKLLLVFLEEAKAIEVPALIVGLSSYSSTEELFGILEKNGAYTKNISVDLSNEGASLEPADPHPSAATHLKYAVSIYGMLSNIL